MNIPLNRIISDFTLVWLLLNDQVKLPATPVIDPLKAKCWSKIRWI
jgi:hypothetical protein